MRICDYLWLFMIIRATKTASSFHFSHKQLPTLIMQHSFVVFCNILQDFAEFCRILQKKILNGGADAWVKLLCMRVHTWKGLQQIKLGNWPSPPSNRNFCIEWKGRLGGIRGRDSMGLSCRRGRLWKHLRPRESPAALKDTRTQQTAGDDKKS